MWKKNRNVHAGKRPKSLGKDGKEKTWRGDLPGTKKPDFDLCWAVLFLSMIDIWPPWPACVCVFVPQGFSPRVQTSSFFLILQIFVVGLLT